MGQQQSKDELLYQQVTCGNIEGIKALHRDGAGLEYIDREGKTPLITACMNPQLYSVAKTLLDLGAKVNAYRPGRCGGTPLHHASKQGLDHTVSLLLMHGANAMVLNDDCQTPLDIARAKGCSNLVRMIESRICLFSGSLRELYGPGFLEALAPRLLSRRVWVVVLPCASHNLTKPIKVELTIYNGTQDAQPRMSIPLWKANMEELLQQPDPAVIISESSTNARVKLALLNERDEQQLQQLCAACRGIPQVVHPTFPLNTNALVAPTTIPPVASAATKDLELAMAISASLQSAIEEGVIPLEHPTQFSGASSSTSVDSKGNSIASAPPSTLPIPLAPSTSNAVVVDGKVQYPSIDSSAINISQTRVDNLHIVEGKKKGDGSPCVICLDALVEGVCVPCGHMVGCMSCLGEVKMKKWGCPICRTIIDQVIKVYVV